MKMDFFRKKTVADFKETSENSGLKKNLRAFDLALLGIGSVVGTGVFVATGQGAMMAGPAIIISFIIAAVTSALCALTYAELSTMFPVSGSTYSYSYVAFGEIVAWIIGWNLMLTYLVSGAAVASGWSSTLVGMFSSYGIVLPEALTKSLIAGGFIDLPAVLITCVITWLLYVGVSESAKVNNIIVGIKVFVILLFIFLGLTHIKPQNYIPFSPYGMGGIMSATAVIFFAYIGFDAVSTAAEETKNPKRDVPLGLLICLVTVVILYVGVALALTGMIPFKSIDVMNAIPNALSQIGISWGSTLVATGAVIGMISTLLVTLYGQVRIFMAMSRDGLLPKAFASINQKHGTPATCTLITGVVTCVIAGFFPLTAIIDLCNIGTLFAFIAVSAGIIVLRKTMPDIERKFRCPWVPVLPLVAIGFCLYITLSVPLITWIKFGIWILAGVIVYFLYGAKHSRLNRSYAHAGE